MSDIAIRPLGGGIVCLSIERPDIRNALATEVREGLVDALARLATQDEVQAVVLTGSHGQFSAGGDLRTMGSLDAASAAARMAAVTRAALAVAGFPKPLVAAVDGNAAGAGIGLALLADMVVASEGALFSFSFRHLALGPDWGLSQTLTERVSAAMAWQWILRGLRLDAKAALAAGLVDEVVVAADLIERAGALAAELSRPPVATEPPLKLQLRDLAGLARALDVEAEIQARRFLSAPHREAVAAFLARKTAR